MSTSRNPETSMENLLGIAKKEFTISKQLLEYARTYKLKEKNKKRQMDCLNNAIQCLKEAAKISKSPGIVTKMEIPDDAFASVHALDLFILASDDDMGSLIQHDSRSFVAIEEWCRLDSVNYLYSKKEDERVVLLRDIVQKSKQERSLLAPLANFFVDSLRKNLLEKSNDQTIFEKSLEAKEILSNLQKVEDALSQQGKAQPASWTSRMLGFLTPSKPAPTQETKDIKLEKPKEKDNRDNVNKL